MDPWPQTPQELEEEQRRLAALRPPPWRPAEPLVVAGCFICFQRGKQGVGAAGDRGWAGAAVMTGFRLLGESAATGAAGAPYEPGLLALREGPLLEAAVLALPQRPDLLVVNATGRDHPRRAGLALHLGARLDLPSVGVTDRPLIASGSWPPDAAGAKSALRIDDDLVGYWVRTHPGRRPVCVHAGWRTDPAAAADLVLMLIGASRTPEPLRQARRIAREARAGRRLAQGAVI